MDELIKEINKYPNETILIVKWKNNLVVKGKIDTIYETDNGLDVDEDRHQEFYACLLAVLEILSLPAGDVNIDDFIEISMQNPPLEVELDNKVVIWKNANLCLED